MINPDSITKIDVMRYGRFFVRLRVHWGFWYGYKTVTKWRWRRFRRLHEHHISIKDACEGCGRYSTTEDSEGVPLCASCAGAIT